MSRSRTDPSSTPREPVQPPAKPDDAHETAEDDRIVLSSWDAPLVPTSKA